MSNIGFVFALLIAVFILLGIPMAALVPAFWRLWRNRGRMHLSTALIFTLLTGALMGINFVKHSDDRWVTLIPGHGASTIVRGKHYGFPFRVLQTIDANSIPIGSIPTDVDLTYEKTASGEYRVSDDMIPDFCTGFLNAMLAATMIAWTWVLCEFLIRRRSKAEAGAKKNTEQTSAPCNTFPNIE